MSVKGFSWETCDSKTRAFVLSILEETKASLDRNLASFIVHGSLAHGCYYPPKSDIDILAICHETPDISTRTGLLDKLAQLNKKRPYTGSIELSLINTKNAIVPRHPVPYILHFNNQIGHDILSGTFSNNEGIMTDPDLSAHLMVAREKGICLLESSRSHIIGKVPWDNFLDAIIAGDLDWILDKENILETPFYSVLNICRTAMTLKLGEGTIVSKEDGAYWALSSFPKEYHAIILMALSAYQSNFPVNENERRTAGIEWPKDDLISFRDAMRLYFKNIR